MKKSLIAFIVLFTQPHSFAMHTLAASRAMRMPKSTNLISSCSQRHYSLSKDNARRWYKEARDNKRKTYRVAIDSIRKEEKEKLKNVVMQAGKLKTAYDNKDIRRARFLGCIKTGARVCEKDLICYCTPASDCFNDEYCHCHQEITAELEALQKTMAALERCQYSLQKLREISDKHWEIRNAAMHGYHKILEDELKDLFESKK